MKQLTLNAPAKVNLGLVVKGKRQDGYHDLETVMQMVGLFDRITLTSQPNGIQVVCNAPGVPNGRTNLVYRAAQALRRMAGVRGGVRIALEKNIPVAAGLGGGSSDAAATLVGLARLWGVEGIRREELMALGATLGTDVPFFLFGASALAHGRGDRLVPVPASPQCWVVLINPGVHVSTAWTYRKHDNRFASQAGLTTPANRIRLLQLGLRKQDLGEIARHLYNTLEAVTAGRYPQVRAIKTALLEAGALGACMSGSGPTVFGLFRDAETAKRAKRRVGQEGWAVFLTKTLSASPLDNLIADV